jgi:hypothetical protein
MPAISNILRLRITLADLLTLVEFKIVYSHNKIYNYICPIKMFPVQLHVYDLSQGMAAQFSR